MARILNHSRPTLTRSLATIASSQLLDLYTNETVLTTGALWKPPIIPLDEELEIRWQTSRIS
jgi:hypothetical protein